MIGVIADHAARYTWFNQSLAALDKPEGTVVEWRVAANRGVSRTALAQACLDQDREWLFFVDDDEAFPADVLTRLLSHHQPVVSALIVQRGAPFNPTAYATALNNEFQPLDLASVGHDNLVLCAGVGTGGLLVRSDVFRQLDPPWFVYSESLGEDLYFSRLLVEADIPVFVDTGCRIGHIVPASVFATHDGFDWVTGVQLADGTSSVLPSSRVPPPPPRPRIDKPPAIERRGI